MTRPRLMHIFQDIVCHGRDWGIVSRALQWEAAKASGQLAPVSVVSDSRAAGPSIAGEPWSHAVMVLPLLAFLSHLLTCNSNLWLSSRLQICKSQSLAFLSHLQIHTEIKSLALLSWQVSAHLQVRESQIYGFPLSCNFT